ncbi:tol-pal system protein YbgF [Roseovarius sp. D22-M7]|uniref:tol-pal system protein YbgF n=1 Tax=Roseovarius sp. D22-M7 TaxID=3127116 RepID=UPI0030105BC0
MRYLLASIALLVALAPGGAVAQDNQTLADIRQELSVLSVELKKLRRELNTTGGVSAPSGDGSILDRVNAIESEVQRLTGKTEELEFRIERVVSDGTNRLGDLEFRLCELEPGCDISNFEPGSTLGGVAPPQSPSASVAVPDEDGGDGPQLAVGERDDFERAQAALEAGDHAAAAEQFAAFREAYPGSPLSTRAGLLRGEALDAAGRTADAARAYLDAFSAAPNTDDAPEALFRLGRALGQLGQTEDACVTLGQVAERYPNADAVASARSEMARIGCS